MAKVINRSISSNDAIEIIEEKPRPSRTAGRFTITPTTDADSGYEGFSEITMTDRSTQVNFPVIMGSTIEQWKKAIRRHNTAGDITVQTRKSPHSSWAKIQPMIRPRSLNMSTEMYQKSKICYQSEPHSMSRVSSYPMSELTLGSLNNLRDKSPNTTITSTNFTNLGKYSPGPMKMPTTQVFFPSPNSPKLLVDSSNSSIKSFCKCDCEHSSRKPSARKSDSNTPEGLSWRRLHMSRAKLKATATTSELLSGFAMVAMVELQINEPTNVPEWLFVMFAVCTTILVAVHIFALMISTYILPNIDAISKLDISELVTESPHERMRGFIELAWAFSTILGLFLFLVEVAILCWVKFWDYSFTAAIAATVIVIPVLIIFVLFAMHFYHSLVVHKCVTSVNDMETLENMKKQLDEVSTSPV